MERGRYAMNRRRAKEVLLRPLLPALFCLLLCACAGPMVGKDILVPAQAENVARLTRLRVLPFDNDPGGQTRSAVETALLSVNVKGKPYFTMLGADAPEKSQGVPMQWSAAGKSSNTKAKPIRYGSEGSVQGAVNRNGWHDERFTEYRRECVLEDSKGRCLAWGKRPIVCVRRTATFSFTPKVVDKESGMVLLSQEFSASEKSQACLDNSPPKSGQDMLAAARSKAVAAFRDHVAPHMARMRIPLLAEDASMDQRLKTIVAGGIDFAASGQTDQACTLWRGEADEHAAGFVLPYLCGVCAELEDDIDQAESLYLLAQKRSAQPVPEIAAALSRVRATRDNLDRLENQMK
jgi:hypothetical protein